MTDEEIIAAADACGLMLFGLGMDKAKFEFCILAFAKFVGKIERFKEREACALVCDGLYKSWINIEGRYEFMGEGAEVCANEIRARGEA